MGVLLSRRSTVSDNSEQLDAFDYSHDKVMKNSTMDDLGVPSELIHNL